MSDRSSPEPPTAQTRVVVTSIFNELQPHAQSAKVFVRDGVTTISFEMPKDVKITRKHFALVENRQRGAHCWVEWMERGLRLCVKLGPPPRGTKRRSSEGMQVQANLKKQRSHEKNDG